MIKRFLITIFLFSFYTIIKLEASEGLMYVWAPHGLNIRSEPNTNSKILGVLSYGDSLTVIERTDRTFTNLFIANSDEEKHPIYLKNRWVKIKGNGIFGFIIDAYLLEIPSPGLNESLNLYLDRMAGTYEVQKLNSNYRLRFGTVIFDKEQIIFPNEKRINWSKTKVLEPDDGIESEADYVNEDIKYFRGFSKQELLVFLNPFYGLESDMFVQKNWVESVFLAGGIQTIELTFFPNSVIIFYFFASC